MVFGHSNYPGIEGFTLFIADGTIIVRSLDGTRYSAGYVFNNDDIKKAVPLVESENLIELNKLALARNKVIFF